MSSRLQITSFRTESERVALTVDSPTALSYVGSYVGAYLIDASGIPGDLGAYARYAYDKLKLLAFRVKQKENRQYPPSLLEFEANKARSRATSL